MKLSWPQISLRVMIALTAGTLLVGGPIFAILFAFSPAGPWPAARPWTWGEVALRALGALAVLCAWSVLGGYGASRGEVNPFDQLAESIRRVASGDYRVRHGPLKLREPHELITLTEAFNSMAAALERSEELRANLVADVSHELRTPLTALEGNLRAALDRVYPLGEAEIASLYGQTRHLIRLVSDLHELALADARRLPLALAPADIGELVAEIGQCFAPLAEERGITFLAEAEALPAVRLDAVRVRQVLHNLLGNALRHTPPGGSVRLSAAAEGGALVMRVADTGEGLEPEQIPVIFERFYRADRSRSRDTGGTGLGLAIVSALVAMHGGTVAAESPGLGLGCTITIRLPLG